MDAYGSKNAFALELAKMEFLDLLSNLDEVLGTNENFLLGTWLDLAKSIPDSTEEDKLLYEFNARNQITLWGPNGEILDYAGKQWNGLISDYYKPRWNLFFDLLLLDLEDPTNFPFTPEEFRKEFLQNIGIPFTKSTKEYPKKPIGDSIEVVDILYQKWRFYEANSINIEILP